MNFKPVMIYATLGSFGLATIAPASVCTPNEWCEFQVAWGDEWHIEGRAPGPVITSTNFSIAVSTAATGGTYYYAPML
jgi:hypothetical protein